MNSFAEALRANLDRTADFEVRFRSLIFAYREVHLIFGSRWRSIIGEADFDPWLATQPGGEAIIRRNGPDVEIIRVLERYLSRNLPEAGVTGNVFDVSYRLNDEVLAELANRPDADTSGVVAGAEYLSLPVFRSVLEAISPSLRETPGEADRIARDGNAVYAISDYVGRDNIRWSGGPLLDSCGCLNNFGDKTVYGFQPFWAGGDDVLEVDFSNLSRIGYFAVPIDREGNVTISETIDWDAQRAAFVNEARKYGTSVDLVVYNQRWEEWKLPDAGFIDRLARQTSEFLAPELDDTFLNDARPLFSFGMAGVPTLGDGITLYFDFATLGAEDYSQVFLNVASYVEELRHLLTEAGGDHHLNMLLSTEAMAALMRPDDTYTRDDILGVVESVDHILVLLVEPTTLTKKSLRNDIEMGFSGEERRTVLRKTIPVIHPTKADADPGQFGDDLIYFEDNFGGVGLWPIPGRSAEELNSQAESVFLSVESLDFVERMQRQYLSGWCSVSCPNRWVGRFVFDSMAWIFLLSVGLWFAIADVRVFLRNYRVVPIMGALVALAFVNLYVCDPWLNGARDEILGGMLVLVLVTLGVWGVFIRPTQDNYP
jgi:hypothetical protein